MKNNVELTPQLCFSHSTAKWGEAKIQDIFIFLSTNTHSRNQLNYEYGEYQNIHYGDILVKYDSIIDAQTEAIPYINENIECRSNNIVIDGDIIMADTAEDEIVGKTSEVQNVGNKKIISGLHTFWLRPQIPFAPKYLGYFFNSTQYHDQLLPLIQGAKVSSISKKALINTIIVYPSLMEQQKIADCLSSLDDLIEATNRKIEVLKEHKKGLMQRLFPKDGENVPELRFPEFQNKVWKEEKLGEMGLFYGGGTPDRSNSSYWKGDIGWISSSDLMEDNIHHISITRFISDEAINKSATKIIPKGCVLFVSRVGVGKIAVNKKKLCTSQDFINFQPLKGISSYFVGYYFLGKKECLRLYNQGTSIKGFSKSDLEKTKVVYPLDAKEQQKIADCLSSLDELIEATSRKVEILKEHKKGLMQQLFPKI